MPKADEYEDEAEEEDSSVDEDEDEDEGEDEDADDSDVEVDEQEEEEEEEEEEVRDFMSPKQRELFMWKCFALLNCDSREELEHMIVAMSLGAMEMPTALNIKAMRERTMEHVSKLIGNEAAAKLRKIVL
jgi:hypothetical protein